MFFFVWWFHEKKSMFFLFAKKDKLPHKPFPQLYVTSNRNDKMISPIPHKISPIFSVDFTKMITISRKNVLPRWFLCRNQFLIIFMVLQKGVAFQRIFFSYNSNVVDRGMRVRLKKGQLIFCRAPDFLPVWYVLNLQVP